MAVSDLSNSVSFALEKGFKILFLDECMVTKRCLPTHSWTLPKTNSILD